MQKQCTIAIMAIVTTIATTVAIVAVIDCSNYCKRLRVQFHRDAAVWTNILRSLKDPKTN